MFQNQVKCNLGYVIKTLELLHVLKHTFNYKNKCFFLIADTATCAHQTGHHFGNVTVATKMHTLSHD